MKKILSIFVAASIFTAAAFAQVSTDVANKAYQILEDTDKQLAYHGDYSATITLPIEKPGKPQENIQ